MNNFVLTLITKSASTMKIAAVVFIIAALIFLLAFKFYRKYPVRVQVLHKRAGREPLIDYDRAGRIKTKEGIERYRLFFAKKDIAPPESKYLYPGRSFFNKSTLPLWEENGVFKPAEYLFDGDHIAVEPSKANLEMDRIALHHLLKVQHDTSSAWERNKKVIVTAFAVFIVIVVLIVFMTKGKDIFGKIKGVFTSFAPLVAITLRRWDMKRRLSQG